MESAGRLVEGVYHTWSTTDDLLEGTRKMVIREDDLWIVTLPKAGTTWTQEVISLLLNDCNAELADVKPISQRFLFVDFEKNSIPPYKIAAELASPRLMKTHFQSHQMPEELLTKRSKLCTDVDRLCTLDGTRRTMLCRCSTSIER
ncbi:sulfotransferase 1C4-like isoform X2 [Anneissia japonica]|uniref:sulfotransferase 1C4-like isoform X2 n=1 Tax=Anneissia japonica TaxID=1529436 RepID=UPI00142558F2|nr:sulfotransferase 1C4-like isoform X2 [Anneissia japonica]